MIQNKAVVETRVGDELVLPQLTQLLPVDVGVARSDDVQLQLSSG